jgi:hypothetical protein
MRVGLYVLSLAVAIGPAIARQAGGSQNQPPSGSTEKQSQTGSKTQTGTQSHSETMAKGAAAGEMKTQTFKGVLVDASCAMGQGGAGAMGAMPGSGTSSNTGSGMSSSAASANPSDSTEANRSVSPESGSSTGAMDKSSGSTSDSQRAAGSSKSGMSESADRAAGGQTCPASSSTNQFALKLDDGRTVRFDMVGNQRAQDEMKTGKKWSQAASSGKPIKVKVNGAMSGDKLIVSSIH